MTIELNGTRHEWQLTIDAVERLGMTGWADTKRLAEVIDEATVNTATLVKFLAAGIDLPETDVRQAVGKWTPRHLQRFIQEMAGDPNQAASPENQQESLSASNGAPPLPSDA